MIDLDAMSEVCIYCGDEFTEDNPCWNDDGSNLEGSNLHLDGECKNCAASNLYQEVRHLGSYERMDCDQ